MNTTFIICITIIACVYIICYYINKVTDKTIEHESFVNSMYYDIEYIQTIVNKSLKINIFNETLKDNIIDIKNITSKYVEESEDTDISTKES